MKFEFVPISEAILKSQHSSSRLSSIIFKCFIQTTNIYLKENILRFSMKNVHTVL